METRPVGSGINPDFLTPTVAKMAAALAPASPTPPADKVDINTAAPDPQPAAPPKDAQPKDAQSDPVKPDPAKVGADVVAQAAKLNQDTQAKLATLTNVQRALTSQEIDGVLQVMGSTGQQLQSLLAQAMEAGAQDAASYITATLQDLAGGIQTYMGMQNDLARHTQQRQLYQTQSVQGNAQQMLQSLFQNEQRVNTVLSQTTGANMGGGVPPMMGGMGMGMTSPYMPNSYGTPGYNMPGYAPYGAPNYGYPPAYPYAPPPPPPPTPPPPTR